MTKSKHYQPLSIVFAASAMALLGILMLQNGGFQMAEASASPTFYSAATCGNGVQDGGEQCDYAFICQGVANGYPCDCKLNCTYCMTPTGCNFTWPTTQSNSSRRDGPICGNGVKESGEGCDLGNKNGPPGKSDCSLDCTINYATSSSKSSSSKSSAPKPVCGNGVVEGSEKCDNGDLNGQGTCSTSCKVVPLPPVCGNGAKEKGETCDLGDGNGVWPSTCSTACKTNKAPKPVCGNGIKEGSEACDLGDRNGAKGVSDCSTKCKINK